MSTLPFLLSVADELDNINSQSYMDDFGLGFHPHRQYYRTPTIQLSLPASTDWMQQERGQRYRSHKFYYETQNNLQPTGEENEDEASGNGTEAIDKYAAAADRYRCSEPSTSTAYTNRHKYTNPLRTDDLEQTDNAPQPPPSSSAQPQMSKSTTTAAATTAKSTTSSFLSNNKFNNKNKDKTARENYVGNNDDDDDDDDDDDNIDNSVRMYNLSKKCCKNYHRHAVETNVKDLSGGNVMLSGSGGGGGGNICSATATSSTTTAAGAGGGPSGYKLHSKCMEGNNSSSDESLQKVSSSIEFLTCFLLKRSRAPSSSSSSKNATHGSNSSSGKKS